MVRAASVLFCGKPSVGDGSRRLGVVVPPPV